MKIQQLRTETLGSKAYEAIKDLILSNQLLPGASVTINSMARSLGISPTPVREAFAKLTTEGFLEGAPHKRVRVAGLTENDIKNVYGVRRFLEPEAAYLAAQRVSLDAGLKDQVKDIRKRAQKICIEKNRVNKTDYLNIDYQLHAALTSAIDPFFRDVLDYVGIRSLRIRTFAEAVTKSKSDELILTVTREHLEIVQAILDERAEEAKQSVYKHLKNGEARTLQAVRATLTPD